MTYPSRLAAWSEANRAVLEQYGAVSFSYGPPDTESIIHKSPSESVEF